MPDGADPARVLVVDDEPDLVNLYEAALSAGYDVFTARGGPEALSLLEAGEGFDVALLDRRMPEVSGDAVLDRLHETQPECRVAMVTAVEPDFDVVDMPFDEYLVKPIYRDDIRGTVERLLRLKTYHERCREEYAVASKVAALRTHKTPEALEESAEYRALVERLETLRRELDETTAGFGSAEFVAAFTDIGGRDARALGSE